MTNSTAEIRNLSNDVASWTLRLKNVQNEVNTLQLKKEALQAEMDAKSTVHNQDVEKKLTNLRQETEKVNNAKDELKMQRESFEKALTEFKRDRTLFEKERQTSIDMKLDAQKQVDRVSLFIRTVREQAERL